MPSVLPDIAGLDINGLLYRYTTIKNPEDDMKVHVGNHNPNGDGYTFRETDDWSGVPGNTIVKSFPLSNIPSANWGTGFIEVEGEGTVEDATVIYNLRRTTDFNNGANSYDYNTFVSDSYVMTKIVPFKDKIDNGLDVIGMADTAGKVIISAIVIIFATILGYFISRSPVITLFIDFLVFSLLMVIGIIPSWIMLFILVILLVTIFFKKRGE